jgi:hypothetical protein
MKPTAFQRNNFSVFATTPSISSRFPAYAPASASILFPAFRFAAERRDFPSAMRLRAHALPPYCFSTIAVAYLFLVRSMARTLLWIVVSVAGLVGALILWAHTLPYSGAGGTPWVDFTPDYVPPLLVIPVLIVAYIAVLIRRASPRVWLLCIIASVIPCVAALPSCIQHLHRAALQAGPDRGEGSDPDFETSIAISTFTLSLIFAALLADIAIYGRVYRKT